MIIEQKKAWTGIQARMPIHYRIRDVAKRSLEFILNLDVFETIAERLRLRRQADEIKNQWQRLANSAQLAARNAYGIIQGLTEEPVSDLASNLPLSLQISRANRWLSVSEAVDLDKAELERLNTQEIPTISAIADELTSELTAVNDRLSEVQYATSELFETVKSERAQLSTIDERIDALEDSD